MRKKSKKPSSSTTRTSILESYEEAEAAANEAGIGLIIYGPEGSGKSSTFGYAPNCFFMTDEQEQGIHKLKRSGLVPNTVKVGRAFTDFDDAVSSIEEFATEDHNFKWLILDGLSGIQRLCFSQCCEELYEGDWGKEGFMAFQQGPQSAASNYWPRLLDALDKVTASGLNVGLIAHSRVENYKNPDGPDYDRFAPDLSDPPKGASIWKMTSRWADAVLFLRPSVYVDKEDKRSRNKGSGGDQRTLGTSYTATYTAKNRFNMPTVMGPYDNAEEVWTAISDSIFKTLNPPKAKVAPSKRRPV